MTHVQLLPGAGNQVSKGVRSREKGKNQTDFLWRIQLLRHSWREETGTISFECHLQSFMVTKTSGRLGST